MSVSRRRRRASGSRLFVAYAAASLVPVLLLGAVLVSGYRDEARQRGLDQGRAQAAVVLEMAIAPALEGARLDEGLSPLGVRRLQTATELAIYRGSVVKLRLRAFSGEVAFSDDGRTDGALPARDPDFVAATEGGTAVDIVPDPRGVDGVDGEVIRVVMPVVASTTGQSSGVLELYLPYEEIAQKLETQLQQTYWRLAGGLSSLYVLLALISWRTTRKLRLHAAQRERDALTDGLTGLPNREYFRFHSARLLSSEDAVAVVLVDLDRFKEVNDTLGHHSGDALLQVVAERLRHSLRSDDVVARLGGDEFGLLLPGVSRADDARSLLEEVRARLSAELTIAGLPLTVEASFGIALYPEHGQTVEELLQHADAAMYEGKRGTASVVVYEPGLGHSSNHLVVQTEVRRALDADELVLHYQSQLDLRTGQVGWVEALVRWNHPERGLLAPGEFLPAVEQSGLIAPLTAWVLRRALTDQADWTAQGLGWGVSVNVSARNLESAGFAGDVLDLVRELGAQTDRLRLEVTETAVAADAKGAVRCLLDLAAQGVTLAIDDFGSGYTSLKQLRTLPVSEVKVDRSLVQHLGTSDRDRPVVRAVMQIAHALDCSVTAEGVEDSETLAWLRAAGCDQAQGFLFSRPVPWQQLAAGQSLVTATRTR